jgi:hypothetical protein
MSKPAVWPLTRNAVGRIRVCRPAPESGNEVNGLGEAEEAAPAEWSVAVSEGAKGLFNTWMNYEQTKDARKQAEYDAREAERIAAHQRELARQESSISQQAELLALRLQEQRQAKKGTVPGGSMLLPLGIGAGILALSAFYFLR